MFHVDLSQKPAPNAGIARPAGGQRTNLPAMAMLGALGTLVPLLSGCIFSDTSGGNPPAGCELPAPEAGWTMQPTFTADQQPRQDEVCQLITQEWKARGYVRKTTKQMPDSGDIIDCMDENSVAGSDAEPPPPPLQDALALPDGVLRQRMEIEDYPDLQCDPGTIPIPRPDFWAYVHGDSGATSLEDWLSNYQVVGSPSGGSNRLYAGVRVPVANQGANVNINSFGGGIEPLTMTVHEMVVGCLDPRPEVTKKEMWQQIGIASARDYKNFPDRFDGKRSGDFVLRLQVEFLTGGPALTGKEKGGWNHMVEGFIPARGIPYAPGSAFAASTISTVGGTQYESLFQIKIVNGNWWIGHNGNWLGYYPASLFDKATPANAASPSNLIATQACEVDWYGEVYADINKISVETWTWTDMGSGHFAEDGFGNAAYFRDPTYITADASGVWAWPDSNIQSILPPNYNAACYSSTPYTMGPAPWDRFFYADGPGNDGPNCH